MIAHCWNIVFTIILITLQSLKYVKYPQTHGEKTFAIISPFLWCLLNVIKIYLLTRGNQSENIGFIIVGLLFCIFTIVLDVYFVIWQVYLWKWEMSIHVISIIIDAILFLLGVMMILIFAGKGDEEDEKMLKEITNSNNTD